MALSSFLSTGRSKKIARALPIILVLCLSSLTTVYAQSDSISFFKKPFSVEYEKDIANHIDAGISAFLTRYTTKVTNGREAFWKRKFASIQEYNTSVEPNREDLRKMLGATDTLNKIKLETVGSVDPANSTKKNIVGETKRVTIYSVKWTVTKNLVSEGLLLVPKGKVKASAVIIPDADEAPEAYAGLRKGPEVALPLAESGVKVLIPVLVSRGTQYSGSDELIPKKYWMKNKTDFVSQWTNQTHREWIWRQSFIMGHHIIGMEVQKVLAAVKWLKNNGSGGGRKVGVMGYGEGGLLALYAAAIDTGIDAAWVSGYFGPREQLWREPAYRDVWGLLTEFGDAEIASMITPRSLVIEAAPVPSVNEPKSIKKSQGNSALAGELKTPSKLAVKQEVKRLKGFFPKSSPVQPDVTLFTEVTSHGTQEAVKIFANNLGVSKKALSTRPSSVIYQNVGDLQEQQHRVFKNMQQYIQDMIPTAARRRSAFLKGDYSSAKSWNESMEPYRKKFYEDMVGKIHERLLPMNPKIRQIYDKPEWKGYEVALDVWPGVYAWGMLAVPKGLKSNEKRPAIVMQHGQYGLPTTAMLAKKYHKILPRLVNEGYVVFAPYNAYEFRGIRKAHAVRANLFSIIIPQYEQILNFLKSRTHVDSNRIGLYGKSWGGRTAQRVPIVLKEFKVAVSTAYFNDWVKKAVSVHYANSYQFSNSIGVYNWNMGNTFGHAEMAKLIAPRPFMVVDGYHDAVANEELVAGEFEKVRLFYQMMGISDRAQLDIWEGGHEIDIKGGGLPFLEKYLKGSSSELSH